MNAHVRRIESGEQHPTMLRAAARPMLTTSGPEPPQSLDWYELTYGAVAELTEAVTLLPRSIASSNVWPGSGGCTSAGADPPWDCAAPAHSLCRVHTGPPPPPATSLQA